MPELNWNETRKAIRMLKAKAPMHAVIAMLGNRFTATEINLRVEAYRARQREVHKPHGWASLGLTRFDNAMDIPAAVLAERELRATLVPRDTTAFFLGDPLPGYSAADRASQSTASPSITPDPLDSLMFRRRKVGARFG